MAYLANSIKGSLNIITGCASGLGKATLERFAKEGSKRILGIDRRIKPDFVQGLCLTDDEKARIELGRLDTFDESGVASRLEKFVSDNGPIDNLVNVAGVALAFALFSKSQDPKKEKAYGLNHVDNLVQFNTVGTFNMIRLVARYMIDTAEPTRPKCIVNTSCVSVTKPSVGQSFYTASKSAIDSMTLCIAREFSKSNIRCSTIDVGYFDTSLIMQNDMKVRTFLENEVALCPRRLGHPDEFAHFVQAIVENQMINGACIKLDAAAEVVQPQVSGRSTGQM